MIRRSLIFATLFLTMAAGFAQKTDATLEQKIRSLTTGFQGRIGIFVKDLQKGRIVALDADTAFPTASIVKVPILMGIMEKIRRGELSYHQKLTWADTIR